jgi:hypothetical protein
MSRLYVIMGNDFPDGVCSTEDKAKKVVERLKAKEAEEYPNRRAMRIHWRYYDFEVDSLVKEGE